MKCFFLLFLVFHIFSTSSNCQTYAMLDRRWYKPAILSDSVTRNNLSEGLFPIYKVELDSLIVLTEKLKNLKEDGLSRKFFYSDDFKTNHIEFKIENIKRTYGDGYEINLTSFGSFGNVTIKLSDPRLNLPDNQKTIRAFLQYLKRIKADINKPIKDKKDNKKNNPFVE